MTHPNWTGIGCEILNYLKGRYSSQIIKQDFNGFLNKVKSPKDITVADAKRVGGTALFMTGLFFVGEVVGKNSVAGYNPGYDVDAKSIITKRD
ncbi:hypothetical protein RB653_007708 [Dictyostelium firmibasis]|uniref:Uncharacterized protein n=1 Tax=Dictyostelium firmibasis TaxID=79012 RepID=A0AAN7TP25_9MYCE